MLEICLLLPADIFKYYICHATEVGDNPTYNWEVTKMTQPLALLQMKFLIPSLEKKNKHYLAILNRCSFIRFKK